MQLRNKLLFYFVSLIVVSMLAFGFSAYQISRDNAIENDKAVLEVLVNEKVDAISKAYESENTLKHVISGLQDLPDENYAWLFIDKNSNVVFPKQIKSLFSENISIFPLKKLKNSADQSGIIEINRNTYLWASSPLQGSDNKLFYFHKPHRNIYSQRFSKLTSRLLIVGLIITWVAVWFSLFFSAVITKKIKYHQDAEEELNTVNLMLIEAKVAAEKANTTKSEFLSNMSHEIRTPLTSIMGFAESCLDINQSMKERSKAIKTIVKSSKYLLHIINEILDVSKIEAGKLEIESIPFSLMTVLAEVNQLVSIMAEEKGLVFRINYTFPLPEIIISDPVRIKQILLNLCSNAIKFTKDGYVSLKVNYELKTSRLAFDVIDTGIGISEEQKEKIFRQFEQADSSTTRQFGGTGLGLSLSKQLAEMMKGIIAVESSIGKGSRFVFSLEIEGAENNHYIYEDTNKALTDEFSQLSIEPPQLNGKVLVAEDNEDIQDLVELLLKKVGLEFNIVENGALAVQSLEKTDYDLVFMDMQMPVMDGFTAMTMLNEKNYNKLVIAMTANVMKSDRDKCQALGFSDFVSKPIDRNELYSVLVKYLKPNKKAEKNIMILTSSLLKDEPELIDLIDKFMKRIPVLRDSINLAHSEKNAEEFSGLIHQLKGVGGGYGYPILTELCAKIEFQVTSNSVDNINLLMAEFNDTVEQIIAGSDENHKIAEQQK